MPQPVADVCMAVGGWWAVSPSVAILPAGYATTPGPTFCQVAITITPPPFLPALWDRTVREQRLPAMPSWDCRTVCCYPQKLPAKATRVSSYLPPVHDIPRGPHAQRPDGCDTHTRTRLPRRNDSRYTHADFTATARVGHYSPVYLRLQPRLPATYLPSRTDCAYCRACGSGGPHTHSAFTVYALRCGRACRYHHTRTYRTH